MLLTRQNHLMMHWKARLMNDLIKQEYEVPEAQQVPTPSQSGSTEQDKKEPVPPQEGDDGENKGNDGEESEQQSNPESPKEEDGGAQGKRDDNETRTAESLENKLKQMAQSEIWILLMLVFLRLV